VVEGARLESVYTGNGIAGSNPALSASLGLKAGAFCFASGSEVQDITKFSCFVCDFIWTYPLET
jgi:hypothetical protein